MFKNNRTPLRTWPRCASNKDCRSRAENDKDHIKSELLFARQPDLAAALTNILFLSIFSTETARRSCRNFDFFQKMSADFPTFARGLAGAPQSLPAVA